MNDLARYNYGYRYWLVCVDVYSRYVFVILLKNKRTNNAGKKFEEIIKSNGGSFPEKMQSDEGTEFPKVCGELSDRHGFRVFHTYNWEIKAYHGERAIQTLK